MNLNGEELVVEYENNVSKNPRVSVIIQTYNHRKYINQCLDSILNQNTNFEYEILLSEDNSSDNTRDICIKYANKFPKKIKLYLHNRKNNIKISGNPTGRYCFVWNLLKAKGKYIAICEGDDYWTDPNKLQKQVDFLEANVDYSICYHNIQDLYEKMVKDSRLNRPENTILSILDLARGNFIQTVSIVFRNKISNYPDFFLKTPVGDYPLYMLLAEIGKIYCIAENMAVYRVGVGIWSKQNRVQIIEKWLKVLEPLINHFKQKDVKETLIEQEFKIFNELVLMKYSHLESLLFNKYLERKSTKEIVLILKNRIFNKIFKS